MIVVTDVDVSRVKVLRHKLSLDRLDYGREVARLTVVMSQSELSRQLQVSQPAISETIAKASKLDPVRAGFSGATPYEIAQRFVVGQISRDTVIDELARWKYTQEGQSDGHDWLYFNPPGTFREVTKAFTDGLIDKGTYQAILDRSEELKR